MSLSYEFKTYSLNQGVETPLLFCIHLAICTTVLILRLLWSASHFFCYFYRYLLYIWSDPRIINLCKWPSLIRLHCIVQIWAVSKIYLVAFCPLSILRTIQNFPTIWFSGGGGVVFILEPSFFFFFCQQKARIFFHSVKARIFFFLRENKSQLFLVAYFRNIE